jgi:hypothetical protein
MRCAGLIALLCLVAWTSRAGDLDFFEGSVGAGAERWIASPASDVLLDIDYGPASAEGGGLYGFSEIRIVSTGDVTLTPTGFWCDVTACLHHPLPFVGGTELLMTGGDDLLGEVASSLGLLSISVSGTNGLVVVLGGEYLDSTGPSNEPGAIQVVDPAVIARVPEPGFSLGLGLACLGLVGARRARRQHERVRARTDAADT